MHSRVCASPQSRTARCSSQTGCPGHEKAAHPAGRQPSLIPLALFPKRKTQAVPAGALCAAIAIRTRLTRSPHYVRGTNSENIDLHQYCLRSGLPCGADLEGVPMRSLALTILTLSIVLAAGLARAQTYDPAYPVCLYVVSFGISPYYRCSFTTMDQCRASANGQMCSLNPYYAGANAPLRRNNRR